MLKFNKYGSVIIDDEYSIYISGANALQAVPINKTVIRQSRDPICFIQEKSKVGGADCMTDSHTNDYKQIAHITPSPNIEPQNKSTNLGDKLELTLTTEQNNEFIKAFKIGILKQLHSNELITDRQLHQLIALQQ